MPAPCPNSSGFNYGADVNVGVVGLLSRIFRPAAAAIKRSKGLRHLAALAPAPVGQAGSSGDV